MEDMYVGNIFAMFKMNYFSNAISTKPIFFCYFQLRHFAKMHTASFAQIATLNRVNLVIKAKTLSGGHISYFYTVLTPNSKSVLHKIKTAWESELQMNLSTTFWEKAKGAIQSFTKTTLQQRKTVKVIS